MAASTSWLVMVTPRFARQTRHRIVVKDSNFPFSKTPRKIPPRRKSCRKSARWFKSWPFFITGSLGVTNQALKGSRFSPSQRGSPTESVVYVPLGTTPNSADTFRSSWIGGDRCDGFFSCGNCRSSFSKTCRKKRCMKRNHTFYLDKLQKHQAQDTCWHIYNVYVNITCVFKEIEKKTLFWQQLFWSQCHQPEDQWSHSCRSQRCWTLPANAPGTGRNITTTEIHWKVQRRVWSERFWRHKRWTMMDN